MATVVIRPAETSDCDVLLDLLKEHAKYEKVDSITLTKDELLSCGFGENKVFECLVAEMTEPGKEETKVVGYMIYYDSFNAFDGRCVFLEDLFVRAECRGQGVGDRFWKELVKIATTRKCSRINWLAAKWNTPTIRFYLKRGAVNITEACGWECFKLNL